MALELFIAKPSSAQGEGGSVLGEWEEREAKAFDPFCLGLLHAPTPGRWCSSASLQPSLHARTYTVRFSCMDGNLEYRN